MTKREQRYLNRVKITFTTPVDLRQKPITWEDIRAVKQKLDEANVPKQPWDTNFVLLTYFYIHPFFTFTKNDGDKKAYIWFHQDAVDESITDECHERFKWCQPGKWELEVTFGAFTIEAHNNHYKKTRS